jgi:hypothetical protein
MYAVFLNSQGGDKEEFWRKMYGYCESNQLILFMFSKIID